MGVEGERRVEEFFVICRMIIGLEKIFEKRDFYLFIFIGFGIGWVFSI